MQTARSSAMSVQMLNITTLTYQHIIVNKNKIINFEKQVNHTNQVRSTNCNNKISYILTKYKSLSKKRKREEIGRRENMKVIL